MLRVDVETLSKKFYEDQGYWPNLDEPCTIQEKVLWRRLYEDMSEAVKLADKVAVREYVRDVVGEQYLVPAVAIADSADELDFEALPTSFILKVNHASGLNLVVQDRSQLDVDEVRRFVNSLLRLKYGRRLGEHWYGGIKPRILVERLLWDQEYGLPLDFRFHTFHGKAEFFQVVSRRSLTSELPGNLTLPAGCFFVDGRQAKHSAYTLDWQIAPFQERKSIPPAQPLRQKSAKAEELLAVAEKLAGDWGYVRVDLYCVDDRDIYFGEMTFAHAAGHFGFIPESYNEYFGSLWDIHRRHVRSR